MRKIASEIQQRTKEYTRSPEPLSIAPKVSVVVLSYNHAEYIQESLLSILNQETKFTFEIIVCDDASSDSTAEIIQSLCQKHQNIRFYQGSRANNIQIIDRPSGRYNAFKGIELAQGEYLSWMDGDDYWVDRLKLQKQVDALENNCNWSGCFTLGNLVFADGTEKGVWHPTQAVFDATACLEILISRELASSRMFRTKFFKGPVPEWLITSFSDQHMDLWSAINGPIGWINDKTTHYRIHERGIFQGANTDFRNKLAFYRTEQLLKHGQNESWLSQHHLLRMFKSFVKSFEHLAIRETFSGPSYSLIFSFGAFSILSLKNKIAILTYFSFKKIQWSFKPISKK